MYHLFVDESGDFSRREEDVAVGGLLFETDDATELERRMREGIERTFALVP